jgi:hypothetical protein
MSDIPHNLLQVAPNVPQAGLSRVAVNLRIMALPVSLIVFFQILETYTIDFSLLVVGNPESLWEAVSKTEIGWYVQLVRYPFNYNSIVWELAPEVRNLYVFVYLCEGYTSGMVYHVFALFQGTPRHCNVIGGGQGKVIYRLKTNL